MNLIIPEINKNQLEERIESIRKQAQETVKMYSGLTDPNDMKDAKAKINGFVKDADDIRKNTTRTLDEAKKALKQSVDEATEEARELSEHYKEQLDAIEEQRKADKLEEIEQLEGADTYFEYYELIPKWLNKGTSLDDIQEQITHYANQIESMKESVKTTAEMLDLNPDDYTPMLKGKELNVILEQMKRDKELIEARLKREQEPKAPRSEVKEPKKTYAFTRQLKGTPTNVKAFIKEVERLASNYDIEIKKEETQ